MFTERLLPWGPPSIDILSCLAPALLLLSFSQRWEPLVWWQVLWYSETDLHARRTLRISHIRVPAAGFCPRQPSSLNSTPPLLQATCQTSQDTSLLPATSFSLCRVFLSGIDTDSRTRLPYPSYCVTLGKFLHLSEPHL